MKNSTNLVEGLGQSVVVPVMNTVLAAIGEIAKFSLVVLFTFCIAHILLANVYDVDRQSAADMISLASFENGTESLTGEQVNQSDEKKSPAKTTTATPKAPEAPEAPEALEAPEVSEVSVAPKVREPPRGADPVPTNTGHKTGMVEETSSSSFVMVKRPGSTENVEHRKSNPTVMIKEPRSNTEMKFSDQEKDKQKVAEETPARTTPRRNPRDPDTDNPNPTFQEHR